jgi:hypothetical protein
LPQHVLDPLRERGSGQGHVLQDGQALVGQVEILES